MSKNVNWSSKDLQNKGIASVNGEYKKLVPVKTGKKLPSLIEQMSPMMKQMDEAILKRQVLIDKGYAMDIEPNFKPSNNFTMEDFIDIGRRQYNDNYTTVKIRPLTQNRAWKGRRFKSDEYKAYATAVTLLLPNDLIVPDGLLKVYYEFGMGKTADFDNPVKIMTDILQAKYGFNDSRIMECHIRKVIVKSGEEYIRFRFESL
jgi:Holliday junction resolvase RusA-like endonuclease